MFDWVVVGKVVSAILAAFFGIFGLLNDFRNKTTNRITRAGYISLLGFAITASLAVTTLLLEQSETDRSKAKTAEQTLALVRATEQSVSDIKRLLWRIGNPTLYLDLDIKCDESIKNTCDQIIRRSKSNKIIRDERTYTDGLDKNTGLTIGFMRRKEDFEALLKAGSFDPDLSYNFLAWAADVGEPPPDARDNSLDVAILDENSRLLQQSVVVRKANVPASNGSILGIDDLDGSYMVFFGLAPQAKISKFEIKTESGIYADIKFHDCHYETHSATQNGEERNVFSHLGEFVAWCQIIDNTKLSGRARK